MNASVPAPKARILSARRLALLAGFAGLGVTVLLGGAGLAPKATGPGLTDVAFAQGAQRPVGFADIVEKGRRDADPRRIAAMERCERVRGITIAPFDRYFAGAGSQAMWHDLAEACRTGKPL